MDEPRRPTFVEMITLLQGVLMLTGYVLTCDGNADDAGVTFGPEWWAMPATTWHPRYGDA